MNNINLSDLHTHTLACGHAYSTIYENISHAAEIGLLVLGLSEHGYGMTDLSPIYFKGQRNIPEYVKGVRILKGIEANIIDYSGKLFEESVIKYLDYAIASLHLRCISPGSRLENTKAVLGAIDNEGVSIIGHLDDLSYPIDYDEVVRALKTSGKTTEINNASLMISTNRVGARENYKELFKACEKHSLEIFINSDAHFASNVGEFKEAFELIEEYNFPKELILNLDKKKIERQLGIKIGTE